MVPKKVLGKFYLAVNEKPLTDGLDTQLMDTAAVLCFVLKNNSHFPNLLTSMNT